MQDSTNGGIEKRKMKMRRKRKRPYEKGVKRLIEYEKFRELLDERNLTPYAVSKATGIPSTCLADWKSGRSKPKSDKLYILAKYFNVPMEYFFE